MNILIVGAGYLGKALWERRRLTDTVYLARRTPPDDPMGIAMDVTRPETLQNLPDVGAIYYAVAADESSDEAYKKAYSDGLNNLIAAYRTRKPRFVLASSTSVYSESQGGWVYEADGALVTEGPSRFIVAGEKALLASGFPGAILRYGGIYGPGREAFARRVRERQEALSDAGGAFTNRIHQSDAVGIADFFLSRTDAAMHVINAVDRAPAERNEVIHWLIDYMGVDRAGYPSVAGPTRGLHRGNKRISNARLRDLGYQFQYPTYKEGYAAILSHP